MHKTVDCAGRWIDIGTLQNPRLQLCDVCRATRQKPGDDENLVSMSREEGLRHLKEDLEEMDPVHEEDGKWWFYDETWTSRHGPFDDKQAAEDALVAYVAKLEGDGSTG